MAENEISAHEEGVKRQGVAMFSGRRILVVDDSRHFRQMPKKALIALGAQVDEAEDGNQALAKLLEAPNGQIALSFLNDASMHVDAVITDIHMPDLSGIEIVHTLRARPRPRGTMPVIALSARSDEAMMSEAREAGINDFLIKPVQSIKLLESLSRQLGIAIKDVRVDALAAPQASAAVHALIDVARLDSLRRLGLIKADLAHALEDMRTKFGQLAGYVAANDMGRAKTLMHALMGLAGHLGARAFHDELRARYALMVETGQWPPDGDWLLKLRQLFTDTDRLLRARTGV